MRTRKLVVTALCGAILAANQASANGFTVNEASANGLGGASAAVSGSAFVANPGLLSREHQSKRFMLSLASLSASVEDPLDASGSFQDFINDDLEIFTNYLDKETGIAEATTNLTDAASAVDTAAGNFDPEDRATFDTLRDRNTDFSNRNTEFQSELSELQGVVGATERGLDAVDDKPVNVSVLAGLGLSMPRGDFPWAIGLNNSVHGGTRIKFDSRDTSQFFNALDDTNEYSDEVLGGLSSSITTLLNTAEAYIDCVEANVEAETQSQLGGNPPTPGFDPIVGCETEQGAFNTAQAGLTTAQEKTTPGNPNSFESENGFFTDGSPVDEFFNDEYFTKVDVLGALISELAFSTARDFTAGRADFTVGATLKAQYIQVIGKEYGESDEITTEALLDDVETYFSGNIDVGVANTTVLGNYGSATFGLVVRDLIPMSFEAQDGRSVEIGPKVRAGVAHNTRWTMLALDLDLTENEPIGYGVNTRYLSVGAEARLLQHAALRLGYRSNLALDDSTMVSAGLGLTPFGTGIDASVWTKVGESITESFANAGASVTAKVTF